MMPFWQFRQHFYRLTEDTTELIALVILTAQAMLWVCAATVALWFTLAILRG